MKHIKAEEVGTAAMQLGAGRATKEDVIDTTVGIELCAKVGNYVETDKPIAYIYSNNKSENHAKELIVDAYVVTDEKQEPATLVYKIIE